MGYVTAMRGIERDMVAGHDCEGRHSMSAMTDYGLGYTPLSATGAQLVSTIFEEVRMMTTIHFRS